MAMDPFEEDIARPFGVAPKGATASRQVVATLGCGDTAWTVPRTSRYTIYAWGGGVAGFPTCGSGALCRITRLLPKGATLSLSIGKPGPPTPADTTTVSLTGLFSLSAGGGASGAGGVASGGDLNVNGGALASPLSAAGASDGTAIGKGGSGGSDSPLRYGSTPGGAGTNTGSQQGGAGLVIIVDETP